MIALVATFILLLESQYILAEQLRTQVMKSDPLGSKSGSAAYQSCEPEQAVISLGLFHYK